LYARYGTRGGEPYAPDVLVGLLLYGYATGVFSTRKIERYTLKTAPGNAIDGARTCTVEPVIGIVKEVLGVRQFSPRGLQAASGEWRLVCLAFNLKRLQPQAPAYPAPRRRAAPGRAERPLHWHAC